MRPKDLQRAGGSCEPVSSAILNGLPSCWLNRRCCAVGLAGLPTVINGNGIREIAIRYLSYREEKIANQEFSILSEEYTTLMRGELRWYHDNFVLIGARFFYFYKKLFNMHFKEVMTMEDGWWWQSKIMLLSCRSYSCDTSVMVIPQDGCLQ